MPVWFEAIDDKSTSCAKFDGLSCYLHETDGYVSQTSNLLSGLNQP
jgi:hypothetical protein